MERLRKNSEVVHPAKEKGKRKGKSIPQGLKPADCIRFIGMTGVMPFYKTVIQ
jgi:hypothetical protein